MEECEPRLVQYRLVPHVSVMRGTGVVFEQTTVAAFSTDSPYYATDKNIWKPLLHQLREWVVMSETDLVQIGDFHEVTIR